LAGSTIKKTCSMPGSGELVQQKFTEHANAPLAGSRRAHADRRDLLTAGQVSESDRASCGRHEANYVHGYRGDAMLVAPKLPRRLAAVPDVIEQLLVAQRVQNCQN
jgi:hypothetical protein